MTTDVLLVDEQRGEALQLREEWGEHGVRLIQCQSLDEPDISIAGRRPANCPEPPYPFALPDLDLDPGVRTEGRAGGLLAAPRLRQWAGREYIDLPIVLRTSDIDDDRRLAAVLIAEILDEPIAWWGKSSD